MERLLKLTNTKGSTILIGVESIIDVKEYSDRYTPSCTKIQIRGGMVETNFVIETPEEIYKMYWEGNG